MTARNKLRIILGSSFLGVAGLAILSAGAAAALAGDWRTSRLAVVAGLGMASVAVALLTPFGRSWVVRILAAGIALSAGWGAAASFRSEAYAAGALAALACVGALAALVAAGSGGWFARTWQFNRDPQDRSKHAPWAFHGDERLLRVADAKLARFHPELFGPRGVLADMLTVLAGRFVRDSRMAVERAALGADVQAAVVVAVWPLTVAVYSDELDTVCMLEYPDEIGLELVERFGLEVGSRLLGLVVYRRGTRQVDLPPGAEARPNPPGEMWPLVADFLCWNLARIEALKKRIPESHWHQALDQGHARNEAAPHGARSGLPLRSRQPKPD